MTTPIVKVQIAFTTAPDASSPSWVDVSSKVSAVDPITFNRGRSDELADVEPGRASLTLFNDSGDFTPDNEAGTYYPNVKPYRRIRISVYDGSGYVDRFDGTIDEWTVEPTDDNNGQAVARVTCTERLARLGFLRKLRAQVVEEITQDSPYAYFPLAESGGSYVGSIAETPTYDLEPITLGTGGELDLGGGTGPGYDQMGAALFTPTDASNGIYLKETLTSQGSAYSKGGECFIRCADPTYQQRIFDLRSNTFSISCRVYINSSGKLCAKYDSTFGTTYTITGATSVGTGTRHVALTETVSGGTVTATLYLDGVSQGTATYAAIYGAFVTGWDSLHVGGGASGELFTGSISHVAVYASGAPSSTRLNVHKTAGLTGYAGEACDDMIRKWLGWLGVDSGDFSFEAALCDLGYMPTADATVSDLIADAMRVEWGMFFTDGSGRFVMHNRQHRYGVAAALTLDASNEEIETDFTPKSSSSFLLNDLMVNRSDGIYYRAVNNDSVDDLGTFADSRQSFAATDTAMKDAAHYEVQKYGTAPARVPSLTVDVLTNEALLDDVLAVELGDRIDVENLPTPAPATDMSFFVEGISETIAYDEHTVTFFVSPASSDTAWILDDATYSVLDSTTRLGF